MTTAGNAAAVRGTHTVTVHRLPPSSSIDTHASIRYSSWSSAVTAAIAYAAWSHPGRIRSEAAFASLAGVNPIPASSGNTVRHLINRGGDRRLNRALHMAVVTRMRMDPETRAYVDKRTAQGRTPREIRRSLKRYLARQIYRQLNATITPAAAA